MNLEELEKILEGFTPVIYDHKRKMKRLAKRRKKYKNLKYRRS